MMRKESGSNSLTFFVACLRDSPRPSLPAGFELSPRPTLPAGRDFGPVRTCGAFPPTAARRAPHRSRSHGRLRRPKSLPIRHSPAAAQCSSPWAGRIAPDLTSALAAIVKSGPEIKNHCSAIVPARRMARLQQTMPLRCRVRFQFSSSQSRTVPPAAPSCRQVGRPKAQRLQLRFQRKYHL